MSKSPKYYNQTGVDLGSIHKQGNKDFVNLIIYFRYLQIRCIFPIFIYKLWYIIKWIFLNFAIHLIIYFHLMIIYSFRNLNNLCLYYKIWKTFLCFLTSFSSSSYSPYTAPKKAPNQRNNINYDMFSYERNYLEFKRIISLPFNILLQNFINRWFLIKEI